MEFLIKLFFFAICELKQHKMIVMKQFFDNFLFFCSGKQTVCLLFIYFPLYTNNVGNAFSKSEEVLNIDIDLLELRSKLNKP